MGISEDELEQASHILRTPSALRSRSDVHTLVALTKGVNFFKSLSELTHESCCRLMRLRHGRDGECLFRYGDPGDSFCIILRGKVSVRVPESDPSSPNKFHTSTRPPRLTEVAILPSGSSFGELALLQNKPRAASVLCLSPCLFAILDKSDFNKVLREEEERKMKAKVGFLQSLAVFGKWSSGQLRKLCFYVRETTYRPYQNMYQEGEKAGDVYFLVEGEVVLSKKLEGRQRVLWIKAARDMVGAECLGSGQRHLTCTAGPRPVVCYVISKFDYEKRIADEETRSALERLRALEEDFIVKRVESLERAEIFKAKPVEKEIQRKKKRESPISALKLTVSKRHYRMESDGIRLPPLIEASLTLSESFSIATDSFSYSVSPNKRSKVSLPTQTSQKRSLRPIPSKQLQSTHLLKATLPIIDTNFGETYGVLSFLTEPTTCLPTARLNDP